VEVGDHVDVFAGFNVIALRRNGMPIAGATPRPVLRTLFQDVPVVSITQGGSGLGGGNQSNVGLRLTLPQAAKIAFASDNGKLWLALRPAAGAPKLDPSFVTIETSLLGVSPVVILHAFRGQR
jgi:Flp pilus assembly protein CpaB